jgi:hypothetical protein|eukprot:SAG25_NODE_2583_length_1515_cov_4.945621_3_plen_53_part_00
MSASPQFGRFPSVLLGNITSLDTIEATTLKEIEEEHLAELESHRLAMITPAI